MSQPLPTSAQPTDVYGGDEVSALVLDPGYCTTRAGFAGEDCPKVCIPSFYAHVDGRDLFGDEVIIPRAGLEVRNYMSHDSVVEDWDAAAKLWEHALVKRLQSGRPTPPTQNGLNIRDKDASGDVEMEDADAAGAIDEPDNPAAADEKPLAENPLLMTEAPWNTAKNREKAIEIVMESWASPAFWLARTPVLAAFAAGKATALVIDVGGANTSVTAVHDGLVLKRSVQRSPVGGLQLSGQIRRMWETAEPRVDLVPTFAIENKRAVEPLAPPDYRPKTFPFPISPSFRAYEEERLVTEFKESVVEVWRGPAKLTSPDAADALRVVPGRVFEMPNGSNRLWTDQRFRVTEGMWDESMAYPGTNLATTGNSPAAPDNSSGTPADPSAASNPPAPTIPDLIQAAISAVDVDLRGNLLANVVVTGSTTLLNGFNDRLNNELAARYPGMRIRIHAAGLTSERRFGAWIGGSILASLGTFHQMWISRQEYEENGPGVVEKRCK